MERSAHPEDPFAAAASCEVVDANPRRAVVEQAALVELDNHVGVRHASALHAAGCEASRTLVAAALAARDGDATMRLTTTEIAFTAVGVGRLRTVAEPSGADWDDFRHGSPAELACAVTTRDESGKMVAELTVIWTAT